DATQVSSGGEVVSYDANLELVKVFGLDDGDSFAVTPSSTTAFDLHGGDPVPPTAMGDSLSVDPTGTTNPALTYTSSASGYAGTYTFDDRQSVTFQEMEML